MNKAPWIFLGVLFTLSLSWWGMVFGPSVQLAGQSADKGDGTAVLHRVGLAKQGEQVYRENGCYYCHTRTATGGEFGYELRLTQLGDDREITDEVLGDSVKEGDDNHRLINLAFAFKTVAKSRKAVVDASQAATEAKDEEKAELEAAAADAENALASAYASFKTTFTNAASGISDQKGKDNLLFAAYGLSGVELKEKSVMTRLGMGEQIVEANKKIADEAVIKLTDGTAKWNARINPKSAVRLKDLVRGLKTRAGAQFKLQPVVIKWPDVQNGVALRQSVSRDFMHDAHAMPGVMRLGPDLANAGGKPALVKANQFYLHLYQPRLISEKSAMPPYRYLFRKVKLNAGEAAPDNALKHADLEEGYAIIPTEKAEALFEFLKSLRTDALPEAPLVDNPQPVNDQ
ncbi:MAG: cbb3-type cytochrome c oxidase subunit II [Verrucomicrobia subdivision 3 bacterium]|nr:cbb3-type cytochrome c oxidase subunit II [Limisphaerales bacterium]